MDERELPRGWTTWHGGVDDILVLTFRPDIFDGSAYPAPCLPTLAVKPERSRGRRGRPRSSRSGGTWCAELTIEPNVTLGRRTAPDRATAIDRGIELAEQFVCGSIDLREAYPEPREAYLEKVEELVGNEA